VCRQHFIILIESIGSMELVLSIWSRI
jgi:hypothetical protein